MCTRRALRPRHVSLLLEVTPNVQATRFSFEPKRAEKSCVANVATPRKRDRTNRPLQEVPAPGSLNVP